MYNYKSNWRQLVSFFTNYLTNGLVTPWKSSAIMKKFPVTTITKYESYLKLKNKKKLRGMK